MKCFNYKFNNFWEINGNVYLVRYIFGLVYNCVECFLVLMNIFSEID